MMSRIAGLAADGVGEGGGKGKTLGWVIVVKIRKRYPESIAE